MSNCNNICDNLFQQVSAAYLPGRLLLWYVVTGVRSFFNDFFCDFFGIILAIFGCLMLIWNGHSPSPLGKQVFQTILGWLHFVVVSLGIVVVSLGINCSSHQKLNLLLSLVARPCPESACTRYSVSSKHRTHCQQGDTEGTNPIWCVSASTTNPARNDICLASGIEVKQQRFQNVAMKIKTSAPSSLWHEPEKASPPQAFTGVQP